MALSVIAANVAAVNDSYLRFPHLHGELVTFVAEDDVWLAPLGGGRAWRVSADQVTVSSPRFSADGTRLAWTSWRDVEPEVHVAPADGGPSRRLTYWADVNTDVIGWTADGEVLAISTVGQPSIRRTWAYAVNQEGAVRKLPYGPVGGIATGPDGAVILLERQLARTGLVEAVSRRHGGQAVARPRRVRRVHPVPARARRQPVLADVGG